MDSHDKQAAITAFAWRRPTECARGPRTVVESGVDVPEASAW